MKQTDYALNAHSNAQPVMPQEHVLNVSTFSKLLYPMAPAVFLAPQPHKAAPDAKTMEAKPVSNAKPP